MTECFYNKFHPSLSLYWIRQAISRMREGGDRAGAAKAEAEIVAIGDQKDAQINRFNELMALRAENERLRDDLEEAEIDGQDMRQVRLQLYAERDRLRGLLREARYLIYDGYREQLCGVPYLTDALARIDAELTAVQPLDMVPAPDGSRVPVVNEQPQP